MGGPASYTDDMLRQLHAHLDINDAAFDEMASVFKATLEEAGMDEDDIAVVVRGITDRRPFIVNSS